MSPQWIFVSAAFLRISCILTEKALENGVGCFLYHPYSRSCSPVTIGADGDPGIGNRYQLDPGKEQTKRFMDIVLSFLGLVVLSPIC